MRQIVVGQRKTLSMPHKQHFISFHFVWPLYKIIIRSRKTKAKHNCVNLRCGGNVLNICPNCARSQIACKLCGTNGLETSFSAAATSSNNNTSKCHNNKIEKKRKLRKSWIARLTNDAQTLDFKWNRIPKCKWLQLIRNTRRGFHYIFCCCCCCCLSCFFFMAIIRNESWQHKININWVIKATGMRH